jgi:hypothetical protein
MQLGLEKHGVYLAQAAAGGLLQRSGAFWIGVMELLRESLGGLMSRLSRPIESKFRSQRRALSCCYAAATLLAASIVVAVAALEMWLVLPVIFFILLTAVQNLRRPIFVSALNQQMEKSMRATVLSIESVGRAIVVAMVLPAMGFLADRFGLQFALTVPLVLLILGLWLPVGTGSAQHGLAPTADSKRMELEALANHRQASPRSH